MKSPDRWNDTLIKSPHGDLSKQDVFDFYNSPGIKKHVLKSIGDNSFIVRQTFKPGNTVLRRKMPNGALINKSHLPKLLETRATEIHPTFGKKVDTILADIDPQKGVPWKKTKSITELVAKTMMSSPDVKDVSVRFSGGTGFYVQGKLPKPIDVNKARDLSKQILDGITKRPDVTFGVAKPGQIRIDTTPLKVRGSIRGAYSLNATTGLVSAPVTMAKLPKVEKSDFTVKSVLKRAAAMHFPKGYGPAVAAGKKNTTVRMFNELGKYKTDETYDSPQGKIHIDSVVRAKVKELRDHGILQSSLKRIAREGGKPSTPVDLIRFRKVSTHKSSIPASILEEALKELPAELADPVIAVGRGRLAVKGAVSTGQYLAYEGGDEAGVFDANWRPVKRLPVAATDYIMPSGESDVSVASSARPAPWLEVQFITRGEPMAVPRRAREEATR